VCEVPGWGLQLPPDRVFAEMVELGLHATELGPLGWLPADGVQAREVLDRHQLQLVGGFVPVVVHETTLDRVPGRFEGSVTYHDSCAGLREMGTKRQPRALLAKVEGLSLKVMADCETCCGFGGTFALKFGEISSRHADNKCGHIAASGADAVVLGDVGCMLNIEGRMRRLGNERTQVLHVAEVLAGERPSPPTLRQPDA
jgi:Fe-S oxidoreductase